MAIHKVTFAASAQVSGAANIGGGLISAIHIPTGSDNASFNVQYSPDAGTTWDPVNDESDSPIAITYLAGGAMHQINPPIRAPYCRLYGVTGAETDALVCEIHTV